MKSPSLHRCWIPIFKRHRGSYKHGLAKEPNKEKEKETDGNKESKKGERRNIKSHGSNWESLTSSNRTRKQNSIGNPLPTSSSILRFASLFHREREEEEENENHRVALLLAIKNRLQMGWWDPSLGYLVVHKGLVPLVLLFRTWTLFHSNVFSFSYCSTTRKGNDWENERERDELLRHCRITTARLVLSIRHCVSNSVCRRHVPSSPATFFFFFSIIPHLTLGPARLYLPTQSTRPSDLYGLVNSVDNRFDFSSRKERKKEKDIEQKWLVSSAPPRWMRFGSTDNMWNWEIM